MAVQGPSGYMFLPYHSPDIAKNFSSRLDEKTKVFSFFSHEGHFQSPLRAAAIATVFLQHMELCLNAATSFLFSEGEACLCFLKIRAQGLGLPGIWCLIIVVTAKYFFFSIEFYTHRS